MATSNITIRIDEDLKKQAEELFADLGLNMTTAFIAFIKQSLREEGIPFKITRNVPNRKTQKAIEEIQKLKNIPNKNTYANFSELLNEMEVEK